MKKSLKKSLALLLSALMVISMLPVFAITAYADEWIKVSSNNLSDSHWSWDNRFDDNTSAWGWAMRAYTNGDDQNDLDWNSVQYYNWGDLDNGHIANGYLYLGESTTPITNASAFKIDVEFTFTDAFEITNNGGTSSGGADFLILTTSDNCDWYNGDAKSNYAFKQSGYGNLSFDSGASSDDTKTSEGYRIATNNLNIDVNTAYHYVLTYAGGVVNAAVTDANGNTVIDYGSHTETIDTSAIKNIIIGIGNGTDASYNYKNITYGNVDFYRMATADDFDASKLANPTYTFAPKHIDADINSDYYSNVVYASGTAWDGNGTANNSYIGIGRMDFKIATPYETVLVYDGENEASYPVALEQHRNQSSGQSQLIHYMGSYDNGFELKQDWAGGNTDYTVWPSGSDTFAYYDDNNYNESGDLNNGNNHFYGNKMVYKGSGDTTNYYSVVSNQKFYGKTSYKESTGSRQYKYGDVTSYSKQYVINYQPIYSILADARALADEITTNSWKYTQESIDEAKVALYLVGNCNPNNYDYASDVEAAVKQCAADIKQAKEAYDSISLVKKTFTVTFKANDGSTIEQRNITAGDSLGELPANTASITHVENTNTHRIFTWGDTTAETVVTDSTEFSEYLTTVSCTFTDSYTAPTEEKNGFTTYTCACGNSYVVFDTQDFTAYDDALNEFANIKNAEDYELKYTSASRTAYEAAVLQAGTIDTTDKELSPAAISAAASAIENAKTLLETQYYAVTYLGHSSGSKLVYFEYGATAEEVAAEALQMHAPDYDNNKHYTYSWNTAFTAVTSDATYSQVRSGEDHTLTDTHTAATATANGFTTYTCDCGYSYDIADEVADLTALQTAYDNADAVLDELVGKAAQYDAASVQALIDAVESDDVAAYLDAADPSQFNKDYHQNTIDSLENAINSALAGLTVSAPATQEQAEAIEVYEAAVKQINNLDPDAYDSSNVSIATGISTANTAMGNGTADYDGQTINVINTDADVQDIEDATATILTAISNAVKTYTVTTEGVDQTSFNNGTVTGTETPYTATYGTSVLCVSSDSNTAWFLEIETGTMHKELSFQGYGYVLKTKVMGNTTIKAVKREASQCQVRIIRKYDNEADSGAFDPKKNAMNFADYVDAGSEFELPAAPAFAYYTFDGYYLGDEKINDPTIIINGDTDIVALYKVNSDANCAINATDINNNALNSTVAYNTKVTLEGGEGTYGWVEETEPNIFRPFYIGQDVSFFASENITLMAVNEEQFNAYNFTVPCVNLRQNGAITTGTKVVFNAQLFAPDMDSVQEYGLLIGTAKTGGSITNDDLIIENSGSHEAYSILRAKSTKLIPEANQFTISVNGLASKDYIYRGYVIYKDGTTLRTVYTDIYNN